MTEAEDQPRTLSIQTMGGATYSVSAMASWSTRTVKNVLTDLTKFAAHQQRLLLGTRVLADVDILGEVLPSNEGPHELLLVVCMDERKIEALSGLLSRKITLKSLEAEYQEDLDIVEAAVHTDGLSLADAHGAPRKDRKIVLAAIQQNGFALSFAPQELKQELCADPEVVLMAIKSNSFAMSLAAPSLQNDVDFAIKAYGINTFIQSYFPDGVKKSKKFQAAVRKRERELLQGWMGSAAEAELSSSQKENSTAPPEAEDAPSAPLTEQDASTKRKCKRCSLTGVLRCLRVSKRTASYKTTTPA